MTDNKVKNARITQFCIENVFLILTAPRLKHAITMLVILLQCHQTPYKRTSNCMKTAQHNFMHIICIWIAKSHWNRHIFRILMNLLFAHLKIAIILCIINTVLLLYFWGGYWKYCFTKLNEPFIYCTISKCPRQNTCKFDKLTCSF